MGALPDGTNEEPWLEPMALVHPLIPKTEIETEVAMLSACPRGGKAPVQPCFRWPASHQRPGQARCSDEEWPEVFLKAVPVLQVMGGAQGSQNLQRRIFWPSLVVRSRRWVRKGRTDLGSRKSYFVQWGFKTIILTVRAVIHWRDLAKSWRMRKEPGGNE